MKQILMIKFELVLNIKTFNRYGQFKIIKTNKITIKQLQ